MKPRQASSLNVQYRPPQAVFMGHLYHYLADHIQNDSLTIEDLTVVFAMSRSQLFRKIKRLTGKTPAQLVRDYRLDTAHRLLQQDPTLRVFEVMQAVGFNDVKHFGCIFKKRFGASPLAIKKAQPPPSLPHNARGETHV